ncbi:amino acid transporter [Geopyxis carbonaria]|nr:amino acid transporter [Geopyxis carbonaria]
MATDIELQPRKPKPDTGPPPPSPPVQPSLLNDASEESKLEAGNAAAAPAKEEEVGGAGDPFGNEAGADIQFKTMGWIETAFVMIAETVSLGILSLPSTLNAVGLVPGIILLLSLGIIATYTGFVLGQFKLRFPEVHSFAEAGQILGGRACYHFFAAAQQLFLIFVMGAHILSFSIMMNTLTDHAACTIWFTLLGLVVSFLATIPRTLKAMSVLSYISSASVVAAVVVCMFGVGLRPPPMATPIRLWAPDDATLYSAFGAFTNIIFAYAGHVAFFTLFSEMKRPEEFWKSLLVLQCGDIALYMVTAVVIYWYTGEGVQSPALGSTTPLLAKVAYGIALPTIVIAGVVNGHVAAKCIWLQVCNGQLGQRRHLLGARSWRATGLWLLILLVLWVTAWIIASAIPVFNHLLGLISALFLSWFTYGLSGIFWLHMNWGCTWKGQGWRRRSLTVINYLLVPMGMAIMGLGLYASGMAMSVESDKRPFTCADNQI